MPESLPFHLVDAFSESRFNGNPAGVVLDTLGLDDAQMLAIAREVNASETAFVSPADEPSDADHRIRWFSPAREVTFCGHATLAAAHVLRERDPDTGAILADGNERLLRLASPEFTLQLRSVASDAAPAEPWWLVMPDAGLRPADVNPARLCKALAITLDDLDPRIPLMQTRDDDVIALIRSWQALQSLDPDTRALSALRTSDRVEGVLVSTLETLSDFIQVASRYFAPAAGIPEDPVTGSVHGPLATLLIERELVPTADGATALNAIQGIPGGRTGIVRILAMDGHILVGGPCRTTIEGMIRIPDPPASS